MVHTMSALPNPPAVSAAANRAVSIEFQVGAYESSFSLQIWKVYGDEISIELISPGGIRSGKQAGTEQACGKRSG